MAQRKETTILEVSGSLATPLTVQTSKGTYTVYNRTELNGSISVRSAVDANGNKVVVPNGDYKSHTSNGKSEYTRIYRFKTLYNNNSGYSNNASSARNTTEERRERIQERRERTQERRERTLEAMESRIFSFQKSVDLGLPSGTIWAGYNIGANSPLEAGTQYSWGETKSKSQYDLIHYFDYWDDGYLTYNYSPERGLQRLLPQNDAAMKIWGGNWQIPTSEDIEELIENCTKEAVEYKGVSGFKLTGPNGKSIFFPILKKSIQDMNVSVYWACELGSDGSHTGACILATDEDGLGTSFYLAYCDRYVGAFVRPVYKSTKPSATASQLSKVKNRPSNAVEKLLAMEAAEKEREQKEYEEKHKTTSSTVSGSGKLKSVTPQGQKVMFDVNGVKFNLIKVAGGTFTMGATGIQESDCDDEDEKPAHTVNISDFYIGEAEVTRKLWKVIMGKIIDEDDSDEHDDNEPIADISFNDACEFIKELNIATGLTFRMPTEAEWEYAAKGGIHNEGNTYKYSGSNNADDVAWHGNNAYIGYGSAHLHPVMTKRPNSLGIYDMSGNVAEYVNGTFEDYTRKTETNPIHNDPEYVPVVRGGYYGQNPICCRTTYRNGTNADFKSDHHGIRLAMDNKEF